MYEQRKTCEQCGSLFDKPYTCSKLDWSKRRFCSMDCKAKSQVGTHFKYRKAAVKRPPNGHPCRICGTKTRYYGRKVVGMVHCGSDACREASKRLKNDRIGAAHAHQFAEGSRVPLGWKYVRNVSPDERALEPWFGLLGWECQYKVLTGVHSYHLPRYFRLDFALPTSRLFIEIDGTSHRHERVKDRDARKDALLASLGWRGLRIDAKAVKDHQDKIKQDILTWIDNCS